MKPKSKRSWYDIAIPAAIALSVIVLVLVVVLHARWEDREYQAELDARRRSAEEMHLDAVGAPHAAYIRLELKWAREDREKAAK